MEAMVTWLAPILAALITCAGQLWLNGKFKRADEKRDAARAETQAKRDAEAEWRIAISERIEDQDEKIHAILKAQVTQMRSDLLHKIYKYIDELGCLSTEEKNAFWAEFQEYCGLCEKYGIENDFVDELVHRVMQLPPRSIKSTVPNQAIQFQIQ